MNQVFVKAGMFLLVFFIVMISFSTAFGLMNEPSTFDFMSGVVLIFASLFGSSVALKHVFKDPFKKIETQPTNTCNCYVCQEERTKNDATTKQ